MSKNKIFVFNEGKCISMNSLQEIGQFQFSAEFSLKEQFAHLMNTVQNLGMTVNRNAQFMSELCGDFQGKIDKMALESAQIYQNFNGTSKTREDSDSPMNFYFKQKNGFMKNINQRLTTNEEEIVKLKSDDQISQKLQILQQNL